jgi:phenylalanyl-tRNA synthetase beta chain
MLISYNWLKDFIPNLSETPQQIAEKLSYSLAEVENITSVGNDFVLEIKNIALSHRADLFGELGLAREVAAALGKAFREPENKPLDTPSGIISSHPSIQIKLSNPDLCPVYTMAVVAEVSVTPSPAWLQDRLTAVGVRPINNVVDVTNYLMFAYGQPMHAFDLDKLASTGDPLGIDVRLARAGEELTLIDSRTLKLDPTDLIIAHVPDVKNPSSSTPVALAGIMGGKSSEISNETKRVLIESANFDMYTVRSSSRRHGVRSEASLRFEKGIDPDLTSKVLSIALTMLTGHEAPDKIVQQISPEHKPTVRKLSITLNEVNQFLNTSQTISEVTEKLHRLELTSTLSDTQIEVTIPSSRKDIKGTVDLYEEIGRLYDYNQIPATLPTRVIRPAPNNPYWDFKNYLRHTLVKLEANEVLGYSFIPSDKAGWGTQIINNAIKYKSLFDPTTVELRNPVASEFSHMRSSLIPTLTSQVIENAKRYSEFALFEIGLVTWPKAGTMPDEPMLVSFTYYNSKPDANEALRYIKGVWNELLTSLNINDQLNHLIPLTLDIQSTKGTAFAYEINTAELFKQRKPPRFVKIPLTMPTMQDLSFYINQNQAVGPLIQEIKTQGGEQLKQVELRDVFQNEKLEGENRKSITLRLIFQHPERSLKDQEINPVREQIQQWLVDKYQVEIR